MKEIPAFHTWVASPAKTHALSLFGEHPVEHQPHVDLNVRAAVEAWKISCGSLARIREKSEAWVLLERRRQ